MKRVMTMFVGGLLLLVTSGCAMIGPGSGPAASEPTSAPASPAAASAPTSPAAASAPTSPRSSASAAPVGQPPAWQGQFAGFGTQSWQSSWGFTYHGAFGQSQLREVSSPSAPGGGSALQVVYGLGSSANSCANCPNPGGGQFYTSFAAMGHSELANASVLYLRYYVKFPAGFDFGRGGKLPGLYGGIIGQVTGGHHGQGFSTRYMWRDHVITGSTQLCSRAVPCAEVYLYAPTSTAGYGQDLGGTWNWQADGSWHMVEQRVDRATGDITVWYDGKQVLSAPGALGGASQIPFSGVLFSTFFGGHDTTWGPAKTESADFADFAVSTHYIGA